MRYIAVLFILVGCVAPPAVSDIGDDHVRVRGIGRFTTFVVGRDPTTSDYDLSEFDSKAAGACAIYGKSPTPALSVVPVDGYNIVVLYACN